MSLSGAWVAVTAGSIVCRNNTVQLVRPFEQSSNPLLEQEGDHSRRNGAPGRARTCDIRIRNPVLYPAELRAPTGHLPQNTANN
jgi:hypothetical protein